MSSSYDCVSHLENGILTNFLKPISFPSLIIFQFYPIKKAVTERYM